MFIGICKVGELIHNLKDIISFSDQEIRYLFLCSLLNPFTKYTFTKKKTLPVIHYIISESLKVYLNKFVKRKFLKYYYFNFKKSGL